VLRTRHGHVAVALASQDLTIDGRPASSGFATHSARFIVAHGDGPAAASTQPCRPARAPVPPPPPVRVRRPAAPLPPDSDSTLRERGTWRSTAVEPWNLGQGRPVTRAPREPYGPLPAVVPPPRPPVYTPTRMSVHTPPGPLSRVA
jgi:hypothetical protein